MKACIRCGSPGVRDTGNRTLLCAACFSTRLRQNKGVPEWVRKTKGTSCQHCGFVALHPCQLDVDHIDGNCDNNDSSNLQTLCANCHRLKTVLNRDHMQWQDEPEEHPQLRLVP